MSDKATGADGVVEAVPALVAWVLSPHEDILVTHVLGSLIDNPGPTLNPDGVTAAEVGAELGTVAAAFIITTLEVFVLVEVDLQKRFRSCLSYTSTNKMSTNPIFATTNLLVLKKKSSVGFQGLLYGSFMRGFIFS